MSVPRQRRADWRSSGWPSPGRSLVNNLLTSPSPLLLLLCPPSTPHPTPPPAEPQPDEPGGRRERRPLGSQRVPPRAAAAGAARLPGALRAPVGEGGWWGRPMQGSWQALGPAGACWGLLAPSRLALLLRRCCRAASSAPAIGRGSLGLWSWHTPGALLRPTALRVLVWRRTGADGLLAPPRSSCRSSWRSATPATTASATAAPAPAAAAAAAASGRSRRRRCASGCMRWTWSTATSCCWARTGTRRWGRVGPAGWTHGPPVAPALAPRPRAGPAVAGWPSGKPRVKPRASAWQAPPPRRRPPPAGAAGAPAPRVPPQGGPAAVLQPGVAGAQAWRERWWAPRLLSPLVGRCIGLSLGVVPGRALGLRCGGRRARQGAGVGDGGNGHGAMPGAHAGGLTAWRCACWRRRRGGQLHQQRPDQPGPLVPALPEGRDGLRSGHGAEAGVRACAAASREGRPGAATIISSGTRNYAGGCTPDARCRCPLPAARPSIQAGHSAAHAVKPLLSPPLSSPPPPALLLPGGDTAAAVGVWRRRAAGGLGQAARARAVAVPPHARHGRPADDAQGPPCGQDHQERGGGWRVGGGADGSIWWRHWWAAWCCAGAGVLEVGPAQGVCWAGRRELAWRCGGCPDPSGASVADGLAASSRGRAAALAWLCRSGCLLLWPRRISRTPNRTARS
jgi:hypothetical protein